MHTSSPHRRIAAGSIVALFAALTLALISSNSISLAAPAQVEDCQLFPETGFSACGKFLTYWKNNGALAQQGFPISNVFEEKNADPPAGDGKVHRVQYFQRARFEEHTENAAPYDVLLGLLGAEQYSINHTVSAEVIFPGECQTFAETGQRVCGKFLTYWRNHGGLAQQGLPVSDAFFEKNAEPPAGDGKTHVVQYFQRARFEEHTENAAPYNVLLGLVGTEQYKAKYESQPPATTQPSGGNTLPAIACLGSRTVTAADSGVNYCISNQSPAQYSDVTVYGRLVVAGQAISNITMHTRWNYKTTTAYQDCQTDSQAVGACARNINAATPGYTVLVDIAFEYGGKTYGAQTSFTPGGSSNLPPAPTPTPTPTPTTTVTFISVQGGSPGATASVTVQTAANAGCSITYVTPKGTVSQAQGLGDKTAGGDGRVSWSWKIGTGTAPGTGSVTVTCNGVSATTDITIS
jgi:hypothetical protein